jgi:uncharacterized repeat protein (TIGR03803 family)
VKTVLSISLLLILSVVMLTAPCRATNPVKILHSFDGADGDGPWGDLIRDGSTLYGMTSGNGTTDGTVFGAVFSINTDGSNYNTLHSFDGDDGAFPYGSLTLSGSTLYGMTQAGGTSEGWCTYCGTVFSIKTDGSNFKVLHSFNGDDGDGPTGSLTLSGSTLYGMTWGGGTSDSGTIFSIKTDGSNFKVLHSFNGDDGDGLCPGGSLVRSGSTLYGMTSGGGTSDRGTIFSIKTDGSNFKVLHSFNGDDGDGPMGSLILSGSNLYGMTPGGGNSGTVFSIKTDGAKYNILHSFNGATNDGGYPNGSLILSGSTLYGMTSGGGTSDRGTIFSVKSTPLLNTLTVSTYDDGETGGTGGGTVTSVPSGINCGSICTAGYGKGVPITLTAAPRPGFGFYGWTYGCEGTGPCKVSMTEDKWVDAFFIVISCTYAVSPASGPYAFPWQGKEMTIQIRAEGPGPGPANCAAPGISKDADWISLSLAKMNNNRGSVKVKIARNNSSSERHGTLTIGDNVFMFTQKGGRTSDPFSTP